MKWFVAFIATGIVLGSQTSPRSRHMSPVHISFPKGFYTPEEILTLTVTLMLAKKGKFGTEMLFSLHGRLLELGMFSNLPIEAGFTCFKGKQ